MAGVAPAATLSPIIPMDIHTNRWVDRTHQSPHPWQQRLPPSHPSRDQFWPTLTTSTSMTCSCITCNGRQQQQLLMSRLIGEERLALSFLTSSCMDWRRGESVIHDTPHHRDWVSNVRSERSFYSRSLIPAQVPAETLVYGLWDRLMRRSMDRIWGVGESVFHGPRESWEWKIRSHADARIQPLISIRKVRPSCDFMTQRNAWDRRRVSSSPKRPASPTPCSRMGLKGRRV